MLRIRYSKPVHFRGCNQTAAVACLRIVYDGLTNPLNTFIQEGNNEKSAIFERTLQCLFQKNEGVISSKDGCNAGLLLQIIKYMKLNAAAAINIKHCSTLPPQQNCY